MLNAGTRTHSKISMSQISSKTNTGIKYLKKLYGCRGNNDSNIHKRYLTLAEIKESFFGLKTNISIRHGCKRCFQPKTHLSKTRVSEVLKLLVNSGQIC